MSLPKGQPPGHQSYCLQRDVRFLADLSLLFVLISRHVLVDLLVFIRVCRRDYIGTASPFAQINSAAAVAAEGKVGVTAFDNFLADRAAKLEGALAWHEQRLPVNRVLQNSSHQIIIVRLGDLATVKLAGLGRAVFRKIVHEDFAIDFGRMHRRPPFHQQISFFRRAFE